MENHWLSILICLAFFVDGIIAQHIIDESKNDNPENDSKMTNIYPRNVSDIYRGIWTSRNSSILEKIKFKKSKGLFILSLKQKHSSVPQLDIIEGEWFLRDGNYSTDHNEKYDIEGVYFWRTGDLLLLAVSDPPPITDFTFVIENVTHVNDVVQQFLNNNFETFTAVSKELVFDTTLRDNITNIAKHWKDSFLFTTRDASLCFFKIHFKFQLNVKNVRPQDFGDFTENRPFLRMLGTALSPNCRIELDGEAESFLVEYYNQKAVHYALLASVTAIIEIIWLIKQMAYTSTPSTLTKVSLLTIGQQTMIDSYLALLYLTNAVTNEKVFGAFAVAAFLKFVLFSMFETRYLLAIWKARRPQAFAGGWTATNREISNLYARFYTFLLLGFVLLWAFSYHLKLVIFVCYSFWIPQIICNIRKDSVRSLLRGYIVVTSIMRLLLPMYFYGCPHNFVKADTDHVFLLLLLLFVSLQVAILLTQDYYGPRWFLPFTFVRYNYFRPLEELHNRKFVGHSNNSSQRNYEFECVICMNSVDGTLRNHMVTPCNHVFHRQCLLKWFEFKFECPTCRRELPPPPPYVFDQQRYHEEVHNIV
jgi:hypothetical protein